MHSSVSSTLVTVWAFNRNCFLINVSMSTSVRVLSYSLVGNTKLTRCRGAAQISIDLQLQAVTRIQLQLHFSERSQPKDEADCPENNQKFASVDGSDSLSVGGLTVCGRKLVEDIALHFWVTLGHCLDRSTVLLGKCLQRSNRSGY
jgi:hypothetical protein